jgi:hypothetical protein
MDLCWRFNHEKLTASRFWGYFLLNTKFHATYYGVLHSFHCICSWVSIFIRSPLYWCSFRLLFVYIFFSVPLTSILILLFLRLISRILLLSPSQNSVFGFPFIIYVLFYFPIFITFIFYFYTPHISLLISSFISSVLGSFCQISVTLIPWRWRQSFSPKLCKDRPNSYYVLTKIM